MPDLSSPYPLNRKAHAATPFGIPATRSELRGAVAVVTNRVAEVCAALALRIELAAQERVIGRVSTVGLLASRRIPVATAGWAAAGCGAARPVLRLEEILYAESASVVQTLLHGSWYGEASAGKKHDSVVLE